MLKLTQRLFGHNYLSCAQYNASARLYGGATGERDNAHGMQDVSTFKELESAMEKPLPSSAKVVICGGGMVGTSVAYHLAELGWTDVVVLEQGRLGGGSTWHTAGLLGQIRNSPLETQMCMYSIELYKKLEKMGLKTGWKNCGSLNIARTKDRMTAYKRLKSLADVNKIECEIVSPADISKISPLVRTEDILGGLWIPGDGTANPFQACLTLASEASRKGVQFIESCDVHRLSTRNKKVVAVETNKGTVNCEYFVNCGGFSARIIGQLTKPQVKVPLHPCEHYYLHTKLIPGLDSLMPVVKDPDGHIYLRENNGGILGGGFEPLAKPVYHEKVLSRLHQDTLNEDWDHFHVLLEQLVWRIPIIGEAFLDQLSNYPECFTPDCNWIVGEASEVKNYYLATGMKTIGITAAGGVGRIVANWVVQGSPGTDVVALDIQRFLGLHNNKKFLRDRMHEVPGMHYQVMYPNVEFQTGRNLRMSPIYPRLKAAGAVFTQIMCYERPAWFEPERDVKNASFKIAYTNTFGKPPWFDRIKDEYNVCRECVGLLDFSSFTKISLTSRGDEVVKALQYLCSNDIDIPIGSITNTGMQNQQGGYENDCSLARLAHNKYLMVSPTIQQTRSVTWINRNLPQSGAVAVDDVTSMYTAICIMGPLAPQLISAAADEEINTTTFPFFTFRELNIGLVSNVIAMNMTHTGELGWVLYVPNEYALHVYDWLLTVGAKLGIQHVGHYAMRTLRIERFYAFWGQDLDTTTTPLECGRAFRVKFQKEKFIGKEALLTQQKEGVKRKYVQLLLEDHDLERDQWPWGQEPIYRNGKYVGLTTTTCYGYTLEKQVCLGFVKNLSDDGKEETVTNSYVLSGEYEVEIAGQRFPAKVSLHSPQLPVIGAEPDFHQERYIATRMEDKNPNM